jgi:hypothetical protein
VVNFEKRAEHNFCCTGTGFDVDDTSVDGHDDTEGLDASAAHIANLLSSEPSDGTNHRINHAITWTV